MKRDSVEDSTLEDVLATKIDESSKRCSVTPGLTSKGRASVTTAEDDIESAAVSQILVVTSRGGDGRNDDLLASNTKLANKRGSIGLESATMKALALRV